MSQKKFTKPKFFERIGRMMLARLLERFQQELVGAGIVLPDPALEDKEYYAALSIAAIRGPGLPEAFREVLHRVAEMANTTARGRLIRAAERVGLQLERNQTCTDADLAVQVLLADENLFTEQHSETHIMNLSTF